MKRKEIMLGAVALVLVFCLSSLALAVNDDAETNDNGVVLSSSVSPTSFSPTQYSSATVSVSGARVTISVSDSNVGSAIDDIYKINWGDSGSSELNSYNNGSASHTYTSNGHYSISISIETWKDGANKLATTSKTISVTIDHYSSSTPTYTVTYNLSGGHVVSSMSTTRTVTSGTTITLPGIGDVEKDGTYLNGWALNSTSGTKYTTLGQYTVRSNVTFYAVWATEVYKVYLHSNGGVSDYWYSFIVTDDNHRVVLPSDGFSREGYYLDSWNTSADGSGTKYALGSTYTASAEGEKLYAIWKMPTVTLNCDDLIDYLETDKDNIALLNNSADIPVGTTIKLPQMPATISEDGWVQLMTGWRDQAGNAVGYSYTVPAQESITLTPVRTDYFKVDVTQDPIVSITISNSMSECTSHTVEWGDGKTDTAGSVVSDVLRHTYEANSAYAITLTSYEYDVSVSGSYSIQIVKASSDLTTYTVTFTSNGGSKVQNQVIVENNKVSKPADPLRTGYRFAGWFSDAELTTEYDFNEPVKSNLTLYAKWEDASKYTISFNTNGGSEIENQTVGANSNAVKPDNPTKKGYTFAGWFTDAELVSEYNFNTLVNSNITLYAKWDEKSSSGILSSIPWWIWLIVLLIIVCIILYVIFG